MIINVREIMRENGDEDFYNIDTNLIRNSLLRLELESVEELGEISVFRRVDIRRALHDEDTPKRIVVRVKEY